MTLSSIVAQALIGIGGALILLAGIGVLRFPDVLTRANAATKATGLGLAVVLAGAAIEIGTTRAYVTLGAAILVQFATAPVSGHIIGRAAYRSGSVGLVRSASLSTGSATGQSTPRSGSSHATDGLSSPGRNSSVTS
jgi:multicomponent Na+:H+ antiporter subunit G